MMSVTNQQIEAQLEAQKQASALAVQANLAEQYPPITSWDMRWAYKREFTELYVEYQTLYSLVTYEVKVLIQLEKQLKRAQPNSLHYQSIEQRIVEEYRRISDDAEYQADRQRVNYLHLKLTHIKRMVLQYDQLRNVKPERVPAAGTTQVKRTDNL